ncbi:SDR family NAD(P)-dependent oxidoreductase [Lentzea sp. NEAU-D7]|nr:SDR family NAD(P)-dependent oxidoreductase [Lentzea sp. NEAU-D7]
MAVAVVTGAGSGVGRAAARTLLAAGFQVALAGRREDARPAPAAGVPDWALGGPADVSREDSVVARHIGRVDVLFNNAGLTSLPAQAGRFFPRGSSFLLRSPMPPGLPARDGAPPTVLHELHRPDIPPARR